MYDFEGAIGGLDVSTQVPYHVDRLLEFTQRLIVRLGYILGQDLFYIGAQSQRGHASQLREPLALLDLYCLEQLLKVALCRYEYRVSSV